MKLKNYLEMYHLDTPELITKHIGCLKRNTKPDLVLISSLAEKLIKKEVSNNIDIMVDMGIKSDMGERFAFSNYLKDLAMTKASLHEVKEESPIEDNILKPTRFIFLNDYFPPQIESVGYNSIKMKADFADAGAKSREKIQEDILAMGQIKDDVIFNCNRGEKETMEYLKDQEEVYKETDGKLYYELSWEFIEAMAQRMHNHKSGKYELYNWKKNPTPKSIENMKQAINRHHIEVMKGNYDDADEFLGHIVSYATNSMILWEQLNKR